jgi:hypothetical protein
VSLKVFNPLSWLIPAPLKTTKLGLFLFVILYIFTSLFELKAKIPVLLDDYFSELLANASISAGIACYKSS